MSFTQLLMTNKEIKDLFATIPNLKESFRTIDGQPFPSKPPILVQSMGNSPSIVGTAYDYWLRAYVQRINKVHQETCGDHLSASIALELLGPEGTELHATYEAIIRRRNEYIAGTRDVADIRDCMILANLDHFYRSGYIHDRGILHVDDSNAEDLLRLANATMENRQLFIANQSLLCSPTFGEAVTRLVDGAEGDLILDDMLIDIKCESAFKWQIKHLRQLIGYWIMASLSPSFKPEIRKLGVWNPRYQKLVYIEVKDICTALNMVEFTERFIAIISKPDFEATEGMNAEERSHLVSQVNHIWIAEDQLIKLYYK